MFGRLILIVFSTALVCWRSGSTAEILRPEALESARLVGGASSAHGRLEVRVNGQWGTVCQDGVDDNIATLVCRGLGQESTTAYATNWRIFGPGPNEMPVWITNVRCTGAEASIVDCVSVPVAVNASNCSHLKDVGIVCHPEMQVDEVRLVGGNNTLEGRVEVKVLGQWGTVCNDYFGQLDARAVCRHVTGQRTRIFPNAEAVETTAFGAGSSTAHIWLDNVSCDVDAGDLNECRHRRFGVHNCDHREDVGVICERAETAVRLVQGSSTYGKLQVKHGGIWGTVCDDGFHSKEATVFCRMLGLPSVNATSFTVENRLDASAPIILDNVQCAGTETHIDDCFHNRWGEHDCTHREDVWISCE